MWGKWVEHKNCNTYCVALAEAYKMSGIDDSAIHIPLCNVAEDDRQTKCMLSLLTDDLDMMVGVSH